MNRVLLSFANGGYTGGARSHPKATVTIVLVILACLMLPFLQNVILALVRLTICLTFLYMAYAVLVAV